MFILHDLKYKMTRLSYVIQHFQIDMEKRFVDFHCRTISLCLALTVLIFKYDISEYRMR